MAKFRADTLGSHGIILQTPLPQGPQAALRNVAGTIQLSPKPSAVNDPTTLPAPAWLNRTTAPHNLIAQAERRLPTILLDSSAAARVGKEARGLLLRSLTGQDFGANTPRSTAVQRTFMQHHLPVEHHESVIHEGLRLLLAPGTRDHDTALHAPLAPLLLLGAEQALCVDQANPALQGAAVARMIRFKQHLWQLITHHPAYIDAAELTAQLPLAFRWALGHPRLQKELFAEESSMTMLSSAYQCLHASSPLSLVGTDAAIRMSTFHACWNQYAQLPGTFVRDAVAYSVWNPLQHLRLVHSLNTMISHDPAETRRFACQQHGFDARSQVFDRYASILILSASLAEHAAHISGKRPPVHSLAIHLLALELEYTATWNDIAYLTQERTSTQVATILRKYKLL